MQEEESSLIAEYFGFSSHWIRGLEGERIHYLDEGDRAGRVVLLLHGSAIGITAAANFYLTIPALVQAGHRVIAPDLHGYGFTQSPPQLSGDRADQVNLVLQLMDHLQIPEAYIVGNSMGGMVLTSLALAHPRRVRGGVVVGTGGARWDAGSRFEPNLSSHKDMGEYSRELVRRSMNHLVHDSQMVVEKLVEFRTRLAELPGAYERHKRATCAREASKVKYPFDLSAAQKSQVPMLFLFGREDRINPPEDALAGTEAFAHADLVIFGNCGHWTMIERADEFNHFLLRFIDGWDRRIVQPPRRADQLLQGHYLPEGQAPC